MTFKKTIDLFPADFTFGTATSSYQIEGSSFGSCGKSHWDEFAKEQGKTFLGQDGSVACDLYHYWESDLELIKNCGFTAYRFSFSWPRLLPESNNKINPEGESFYDKLLDGMLERNLKPFATLYHWDLPVRYATKGGWTNKETVKRFAEYTEVIMRKFGDRLETVAPINEPWCVAWLSHYWGEHAPGLKNLSATAKAMHFVQLAHGLSVRTIKQHGHKKVGCVLNKEYPQPYDDSEASKDRTDLFDCIYNRWFEESIYKGRYPEKILKILEPHLPENYVDDLKIISEPLDWTGINYYTMAVIKPDESEKNIGFRFIRGNLPKTAMDWEIYPNGLRYFIKRTAENAPNLPIYITENGMANQDKLTGKGVDDRERVDYLNQHLEVVAEQISNGINIKGYFTWSFLDNFEWSFGYDKRFGLVYVDYETQKRIPKNSYLALKEALSQR